MRKFFIFLLFIVTLLNADTLVVDNNPSCLPFMGCSDCEGNIYIGDEPYEHIKDAVNDANDGDTIEICPGTYNESNIVINKDITVTKADVNGDVNVTKDDNSIFVYQNWRSGCELSNIIIQEDGDYPAISIQQGSDYNFSNLIIKSEGYGIKQSGGSFQNSYFSDLKINSKDLGIYLDSPQNISVNNVEINSSNQSIKTGNINDGININETNLTSDNNSTFYVNGSINGGLNISNSKLKGYLYGIYVTSDISGGLNIENSEINSSNSKGIYIKGQINDSFSIKECNISSDSTAIQVDNNINPELDINNTNISSNYKGIFFKGQVNNLIYFQNSTLNVSDNSIQLNNTNKGIYVINSEINSSGNKGIIIKGDVNDNPIYIKNSEFNVNNNVIQVDTNINKGFELEDSNLTSSNNYGIVLKGNIYGNIDGDYDLVIQNSKIVSSNKAFSLNNDNQVDVEINSSSFESENRTINLKISDWKKLTIQNSCIKTNSNSDYSLYVDFQTSSDKVHINNNCFYASSVNKLAYSSQSGYDWNSNYWNGLTESTYHYNNIIDNNPLSSCPHNCYLHPVADWRMDECEWNGTTGEVKDSSGNDNNGTAENNASTEDSGVLCRKGYFDGSSDVTVPASDSLTINKKITYMAWIKLDDPNQSTNSNHLENIFTNQRWENALRFTEKEHWNGGNEILFQLKIAGNDDATYLYSNTKIDDTEWHHVVGVYDGSYMRIYIDGVEDANVSVSGDIETGTSDNKIASEYNNSYYFKGSIDELKVFNKALSSSEIKTIYDNEKNGKNYDGSDRTCQVCSTGGNKNSLFNAVDYVSGECNANNDWDDNITTKLVNKDYNLTVLAKDPDTDSPLEANITKVELYFYNGSDNGECSGDVVETKVICQNCGSTDASGCMTLDDDNLTVDKAVKCIKVHIEGKAVNNVSNETNESNSTDNYAARPDKFIITNIPSTVKAGNEFNVTVQAVDVNGNPTKDYNESIYIRGDSVDLEYNETKSGCKTGDLNKTAGGDFVNGEANITLKYDEVGDVNLTFQEVNGTEYSKVDNDDTNESERFISPVTQSVTFVVDHFDLNASYENYNTDNNFTYLDDELNISSHLELNISAKNKDGDILENYNKDCYAKDITINIAHNSVDENVSKIIYKYIDKSGNEHDANVSKDENITFDYLKDNFTTDNNGSTSVDVYINFDRNISTPVNPFEFNITNIDVNDTDANGTLDLGESARFYYGSVILNDVISVDNDFDSNGSFVVYDDNESDTLKPDGKEISYNWYENTYHDISDGNVSDSDIVVSSDYNASNTISGVDVNVTSIQNGKITFHISRSDSDVKFAVVHLLSPNLKWLWYSKFNEPYDISSNSTCLNHFCFTLTWQKTGDEGEVGSGTFSGTEANTTDSNSTKRGVKIFR